MGEKAVMFSIHPQMCFYIIDERKLLEVRKTRPKIEEPFKAYIYCTKAREFFTHGGIREALDDLYRLPSGEIKYGYAGELMCYGEGEYDENNFLNGKVIGEFECDRIVVDRTFGHDYLFYTLTCMSDEEIAAYCTNDKMYGIHISDLKIYDKPKELSDFGLRKAPQSWCYVRGQGNG